jgi:hypothetical protein
METIILSQKLTVGYDESMCHFAAPVFSQHRVKEFRELRDHDLLSFNSVNARLPQPDDCPEHPFVMLLLSENRSFRYQCISILEALVEGPLGFSGLEELLLQEPIVLDLDNLPARSLWYVAVWVYANEEFRLRLLKRIPGFQCSNEDHLKPLLGSTIDIGRIVQEVKNADDDNRLAFLRTIARIGNATMLEPFVQADVPLDEGNGLFNYLGAAAQFGNMDTFDLLLTAGANTAKAIPALCRYALR